MEPAGILSASPSTQKVNGPPVNVPPATSQTSGGGGGVSSAQGFGSEFIVKSAAVNPSLPICKDSVSLKDTAAFPSQIPAPIATFAR